MRHYNIPIFIPELACPHQCIFCDQHKISGKAGLPLLDDISHIVKAYLATMPTTGKYVEIAFFGGSFTGLPPEKQQAYLDKASVWVRQGQVNGIRLSTRPDYINKEILAMLRQAGVSCIEIGAQSFDDEVLRLSGRGHTVGDIEKASELIKEAGIGLVLQMMTGLPGDSHAKTLYTARRITEAGAMATRIYPALVIKGTRMEEMFKAGTYQPLTMQETISRCKDLIRFFEEKNMPVLRLGLHPSEGLISGCEMVAGPFHPALKELVMSALWADLFVDLLNEQNPDRKQQRLTITVAPKQLSTATGHGASNKKALERIYRKVDFKTDPELTGRSFYVHYS